jgi:hypothetical protein
MFSSAMRFDQQLLSCGQGQTICVIVRLMEEMDVDDSHVVAP